MYTYLRTYSTEQSPSLEANSSSASQEIPRILWNTKAHYHIRTYLSPIPILSQLDPVHAPMSHLLKIHNWTYTWPVKYRITGCFSAHLHCLGNIITAVPLWTYLLTPWCWVLLEKLTGLQLVKKFPAFHGTQRFITAPTSVRHLSLSWASPIQSIYPHPTWSSILILYTHLRLSLPSGLLPSGFPTKTLYTPSPHPYAPHAQPISFF